MTNIVNMILDQYVVHGTEKLITDVTAGDPSRAVIVKKGLLQTAKTENAVQIGYTGGDHENPEYRDGIVTLEDLSNIGFYVDPREIGGGQMWMRRFVARIEIYYIVNAFNEDTAHLHAYNCLGRVMANIENAPINGLVDDYGEQAIQAFCFANTFFESGGPPSSYIFRGKVLFSVLTERP